MLSYDGDPEGYVEYIDGLLAAGIAVTVLNEYLLRSTAMLPTGISEADLDDYVAHVDDLLSAGLDVNAFNQYMLQKFSDVVRQTYTPSTPPRPP